MKKYKNGEYVEMTAEEIAELQAHVAIDQAIEKSRPLTESEVTAMLIKQQINTLEVDNQTALRMVEFYPEWTAGINYPVGYKVQRGGKLCRCLQAHASQAGWEPESTSALWEYINETHTGDQYDPIPYEGNMELTEGLYYTQDDVVYLCTRSTGQPVYNALIELAGVFVETVTQCK